MAHSHPPDNVSAAPATTAPDHIYIIRHGEKPDSAKVPPLGVTSVGQDNIDSLIPRGWQRAGALTRLFAPRPGHHVKGLHRPQALFSPLYKGGSQNHRTYETIMPLASRLALAISNLFEVGHEAEMADAALKSSQSTVLLCWEHDHIPDLGKAIPTVAGTVIPAQWPSDRFDIVWRFDRVPNSTPPVYTFSQVPQQLLAGDLATVIPTSPPQTKGKGMSL